jgi:oligopeptide/dipeptide ABC transporter ATP-binding protein
VPSDLLSIEDLEVRFPTSAGETSVVRDVNFDVGEGEFVGLIGETGAGKSMTAWSAVGLVPPPGTITHGSVRFAGRELVGADPGALRRVRGAELAIIVQNARAALNPMRSIGDQIALAYRAPHPASRSDAWTQAVRSLEAAAIPDPSARARSYPHELSGGMAQRALIALAMVNRPRLLIADEPTTGLDVTIQAEILDLMASVVERGSSVWIITHDLGIIANYTSRAAVMFAGEVVESGSTQQLFSDPRHPYTRELVTAMRADETAPGVEPPDILDRPAGCQFAYRCPLVEARCRDASPALEELGPGHQVRCFVAMRDVRRAREATRRR